MYKSHGYGLTYQKALDNMTADDPARENTETELQELGSLRASRRSRRPRDGAQRLGTAADRSEMGGRLAYIKERSRKS